MRTLGKSSKKFVESLESELGVIHRILKTEVPIRMTQRDEEDYESAERCYVCDKPFEDNKMHDHCHLTGRYHGAAHRVCNFRMQVPRFVPVLFHNLQNYDAHLFVKSLGYNTDKNIGCIPLTDEKYISFNKSVPMGDFYTNEKGVKELREYTIELRFLDSLKFMQSSLDKLAGNLRDDQFRTLGQGVCDQTKCVLLKRKECFKFKIHDRIR